MCVNPSRIDPPAAGRLITLCIQQEWMLSAGDVDWVMNESRLKLEVGHVRG